MAATLHNRNIGPFIISAALRKDGGRTFEASSDIRDGGPVILALITPGPCLVLFHQPTLDALADQLDTCYEASDECDGDINDAIVLGWTWDEEGNEDQRTASDVRLCLRHSVGMAATEGEVERFLAGREDWQQPIYEENR